MTVLEVLGPGAMVRGVVPSQSVQVMFIDWIGANPWLQQERKAVVSPNSCHGSPRPARCGCSRAGRDGEPSQAQPVVR